MVYGLNGDSKMKTLALSQYLSKANLIVINLLRTPNVHIILSAFMRKSLNHRFQSKVGISTFKVACLYYHKGYLQVYCLSVAPPQPPGRSVFLLSDNASFSPRLRSGIYMKLLIVCSPNSQAGASSLPEVKDRLFDLPPPIRAAVRTCGPISPPG